MKTRFNIFQRLLSVVLAVALVIGLTPVLSASAASQDSVRIFSNKQADPSTLDWEDYFGENVLNTRYAGMVWSDKSVYKEASDELPGITLVNKDNFLVAMSAIASNMTITGHTTAPTDTMLVLDLSASMISSYEVGTVRNGNQYQTANGRNVELVEAMVDATNAAIHKLMAQNPNNRVGVVLFSGNTSTYEAATADTATVVLPLGRYTGISGEYLQMNATYLRNVALYRRSGGRWEATGQTVDYIPSSNSVSVSAKSGLTTEAGDSVSGSKTVVGGTYTQNGLYKALQEFNKVTDTRVPDGKVQAGADRVPAIVLMTDGAPTIATNRYAAPGNSNTGNGSSENDMITFLTQLTAAYVRGTVSKKYTEEGSSAQKVLFLTLGLGTKNSTGATNTLYPAGTTGSVATAWQTYLRQNGGTSQEYTLGGYEREITRNANVAAMNYVDKYYYADDAASLTESFEQIISEIELKAESYATLVENVGANFSGYVTFEDELGELMEVADMKGILVGNMLYTGEELAKGMTAGNLGSPTTPNAKGEELITTVKERIPGTDTTAAQQLVYNAYLNKQLYWENATNWSNYIGWYANGEGNYVGFWDQDSGYENAPADAVYANKSYGYLGQNQNSDMMHVVVMVRTNLKTLHQTVFFKIPAALLPTVTYNVTLEEEQPDQVKDFSVTSAQPMQVVFEVGLRGDINSFNLERKIREHLAYNATEPDESKHAHVHRNADGSVTLYTNAWGSDNDKDGDGRVDYDEALTAKVANAHFHPALENGRYYYTEDTLVLDAAGNPVTGAKPAGTGYHHDHYIYSSTGRTTIDMAITAATLEKAQRNGAGQWYIPAGTIYQELSRFRNLKDENATGTLNYSDYAAIFGIGENQDVYNFLGNNGAITIAPVSGFALTKQVEGTIGNVDRYTFQVQLSDTSVTPVLTDADGNAFTGNEATLVANGNGKFTVSVEVGITAYLTGIAGGTEVTVTEVIGGDYKVLNATVSGAPATVVNNAVRFTVPVYSNATPDLVVPVTFTNAPNGYGNLLVSKDVHHDLASDPAALASKTFTFRVKLEGDRIVPGTSTFATSTGGNVQVDNNGTFTFQLKNEESVVIYDLPEGTTYTIEETVIEEGFKLDSINGDTTALAAIGNIRANQTQQAAFINRYSEEFDAVTLPLYVNVTKQITQRSPYTGDEAFTFVLEQLTDGGYLPLGTVAAKNGQTETLVANLTFDAVGFYAFRVTEKIPDDRTPGMTYSTQRSLFNIVVTDEDMNGKLELAIQDEAHTTVNITATEATVETTFVNIYEYDSTPLTVNIQKQLNNTSGVPQSNTQFRFAMVPSDAQGNPLAGAQASIINAGAQGYATFYTTLDIHDTYYYRIYEIIPDGATLSSNGMYVLKGMYYDPSAYLLKVETRVDGATGALVIDRQTMVKLGDTTETPVSTAVFTNTYDPADTSATVNVVKKITGLTASSESFYFTIRRTNDTYTAPIADNTVVSNRISISGAGSNAFQMNFSQVGTYHYVITESAPDSATGRTVDGMYYDDARYHVAITVEVNGEGALYVARKSIHKLGTSAAVDEAVFTNVYTVTGEEEVVLSGSKTLSGRRLVAGEFEFVLYNEDGDPLDTVRNAANGSFTFKALRFTPADLGADNAPKTYTYTVKETCNGLGGMTYDDTAYTLNVTVYHEDGVLKVSQELLKNGTAYTGSVAFVNTYKADAVDVVLHGSKVLSGNWDAVANKRFTFHLHEADSSFAITGGMQTAAVDGNGTFTFPLHYEDGQEGYYYFVLHEDTTAAAGGIGYDAGEYHITVNVSDPGEGKLAAQVSMYRPGTGNIVSDPALGAPVALFTNAYSVESVEFQLTGTKTLTGRDMAAGEFTFLVLDRDEAVVSRGTNTAANHGVAAAITFEKITYTKPGTYTYTVVEESSNAGGVTNDPDAQRTVQVVVTDNGDGTLTAVLDAANSEQIAFTNTYSVGAEDLYLTGTKTLTGDWSAVPGSNKVFTFHILEGATIKSVGSADLRVSDTITFQKLTFTEAGVYNYTIVEVDNGSGGITYSDKVYALTVTVSDNGDGTLTAAYTVDGVARGDITFANSYITSPYRLSLVAHKNYKYQNNNDKPLSGGEFKFRLTDVAGNVAVDQTKFNAANGSVTFDELVFTQAGTYKLKLEEIDKLLGFIEYSQVTYEITVTVTDNGEGKLVGSYQTERTGSWLAGEDNLIFINTYNPDDATVSISGMKNVAGNNGAVDPFAFALYETDSTYSITGVTPETVQNTDSGAFSFTNITYREEGTHYYVVREIPGTDPEMVYDGAQFRFKVVITDDGGQLKVSVTDESAEAAVVTNNVASAAVQVNFTNAPFEEVTKKEVFVANTSTNVDGQKVNVGDELRYEITYTNYTGTVTNVTIEDTLPQLTTLVTGSAIGAVISDNKLTWTFDDVAPDAVVKVEFSVTVDAPGTTYTNQAAVQDAINRYTTNTVTNSTEAQPPVVQATKAQSVGSGAAVNTKLDVLCGDIVTYYLQVSNTGTGKALNVKITDRIPAGLAYKADSVSAGGTVENGVVSWVISELAPGATVTVSFQVTVPAVYADTQWKNVATVVYENNPDGSDKTTNTNEVVIRQPGPSVPKTGDYTNLALLAGLMVLSGAAMTALLVTGKKKEQTA